MKQLTVVHDSSPAQHLPLVIMILTTVEAQPTDIPLFIDSPNDVRMPMIHPTMVARDTALEPVPEGRRPRRITVTTGDRVPPTAFYVTARQLADAAHTVLYRPDVELLVREALSASGVRHAVFPVPGKARIFATPEVVAAVIRSVQSRTTTTITVWNETTFQREVLQPTTAQNVDRAPSAEDTVVLVPTTLAMDIEGVLIAINMKKNNARHGERLPMIPGYAAIQTTTPWEGDAPARRLNFIGYGVMLIPRGKILSPELQNLVPPSAATYRILNPRRVTLDTAAPV
jgi:hypothetical protein